LLPVSVGFLEAVCYLEIPTAFLACSIPEDRVLTINLQSIRLIMKDAIANITGSTVLLATPILIKSYSLLEIVYITLHVSSYLAIIKS
jgi:hypothetical protein